MSFYLVLHELGVVTAASSDGDGSSGFAFLFLLAGPIFYLVMYLRYRNANQRHRHESETKFERLNETYSDRLVEHRKGLKSATMEGANHLAVRGALNKASTTETAITNLLS